MLRSSLGFHTMTLSLFLLSSDTFQLIQDFKKYSKDTGLIQMYHVDKTGKYSNYNPNEHNESMPTNLVIKYYQKDIGIKWNIKYSNRNTDFHLYTISAKINPKILSGITDYLTAATFSDLNVAITNFNHEAKKISPLLKDYDYYNLTRLDYCLNFSLNELIPECSAEQIMTLIRRSNIPPHYKEWGEYDKISHRWKTKPGSFYLMSKSVHVNCYSKYIQLMDLSKKNMANNDSPIPEEILNAAKDIIRFEVQCKYSKMYTLSHKPDISKKHYQHGHMELLTSEMCRNIIEYYFKKTIGKGDWYTLSHAISLIKSKHFNIQKEKRLIDTLQLINQCRSVPKAAKLFQVNDLYNFNNTLKDLSLLDINPVTIPKEWGIRHIPNLLYTYFNKKTLEELNIYDSIIPH